MLQSVVGPSFAITGFSVRPSTTPRYGAAQTVSGCHKEIDTAAVAHHRVPRTSAQRHGVVADAQAGNAVIVSLKRANSLAAEHIPDLAFEVVVTSKQQTTRY